MKVLIFIPMLNSGGAQRFVTELALGMDRERFDVMVATTTGALPDAAFHKQLTEQGIRVRDVSDRKYGKEFRKIRALLKEFRPDVVHSNVGSALHVLLPVLAEGKRVTHYFTSHSMGYRIFAGAKKRLMQFFFRRGAVVPVAICDTVKKSLCDAYGLRESQVPCVYNGVDTKKFPPKGTYCADGTVHFVSVGTLYGLKNHAALIDAFSEVKKVRGNTRLTIVGGGPLFDTLQAQIERLGLADSVTLTGDQPDVGVYLGAADVYCCPSKVEGLPITVLEAMSTGLSVVTTPAGGVVDIVREGVNGFIVPHGDVAAMAEKMVALAGDRATLEAMGRASREESLRYDITLCVNGYQALYEAASKKR